MYHVWGIISAYLHIKAIYMAEELKKVAFVEEPFFFQCFEGISQQMSRYFVVSFTFATQKLTRKTPKHSAYKLPCQNLRTLNINLHLGLQDIQTPSLHSAIHFHLAVKVTLVTNSISNSEQTDKSFCHESCDTVIINFWKKPGSISPVRPLATCLSLDGHISCN